ncbi:hypothetical protein Sp245p_03965 [Azospirillum baldaniorum]|nr:hypothetical protein Sp245p_03965 [Azospirillum baldaniorum]
MQGLLSLQDNPAEHEIPDTPVSTKRYPRRQPTSPHQPHFPVFSLLNSGTVSDSDRTCLLSALSGSGNLASNLALRQFFLLTLLWFQQRRDAAVLPDG